MQVKANIGIVGELWYVVPKPKAPSWTTFVKPLLESRIESVLTSSASAVLFIEASKRIFAITFGYGRGLLKPDCFIQGFGQRVALNRIDHRHIRSVDLRTFEEMVVSTRKQASRSSDIGAFGLDVSRDLLRAVTGEPRDVAFAKRLTGKDALTFSTVIEASELGTKCRDLLRAYKEKEYKKHFAWVDHLKEVRDESLILKLDSGLVDAIVNGNSAKLHLAAGGPLDWQNVAAFRIGGTRSREYVDLDLVEYITELGHSLSELTIEKLKSRRVSVWRVEEDLWIDKWSLYNCLVWDTTQAGRTYSLIEGKWFEIEKKFASRVKQFVDSIALPATPLPDAFIGEKEADYNSRVATDQPKQYVLMDCKLVKPEDAASPIEFCDLLAVDKHFVHVKKKTESATLSHLFAQGAVSARAFLEDGSVRKQVRETLSKVKTSTFDPVKLIPNEKTQPRAGAYTIAYAIIAKSKGKGMKPNSLPFFSQLNLMQQAKLLNGLGFNITLQFVDEVNRK